MMARIHGFQIRPSTFLAKPNLIKDYFNVTNIAEFDDLLPLKMKVKINIESHEIVEFIENLDLAKKNN